MKRNGPRGPGIVDHYHPEYWGKEDHNRFEDRMNVELQKIEDAVDRLTFRLTMMLGAIGLLVFILPILAPFIRGWLNIPQNP